MQLTLKSVDNSCLCFPSPFELTFFRKPAFKKKTKKQSVLPVCDETTCTSLHSWRNKRIKDNRISTSGCAASNCRTEANCPDQLCFLPLYVCPAAAALGERQGSQHGLPSGIAQRCMNTTWHIYCRSTGSTQCSHKNYGKLWRVYTWCLSKIRTHFFGIL